MKQMSNANPDYFMQNLYWIIAVVVVGLILLYFLFSHLLHKAKLRKQIKTPDQAKYLSALGGLDNIVSHELVGSRIVLSLRDYSKINRPLLQEAGVTGFIEKSDKLTLVVKENAPAVYQTLFPND
jgi:phosphotransferase system IIB component